MSIMDSTATRIFDAGHGVRARVTAGWMKGYLVTLAHDGRVWSSHGLTHLTADDVAVLDGDS